ncbi:unnamed protein product [Ectocarpus sp. CCAP 1310/34]|nr:unnamed protein product [Ectocarpus sp. CCAP 1310/34]
MREPSEDLQNTHTLLARKGYASPRRYTCNPCSTFACSQLNYTPTHYNSTTAAASSPLSRI